ncbi:MAG: hypothetical protein AAGI01_02815 [Myxococcota bacterium]
MNNIRNPMAAFGDVRALLQNAHAQDWAAWEALCALCTSWPDHDHFVHVVEPYIRAHVERWSWDRSLMAHPRAWTQQMVTTGTTPIGMLLVDRLDLYRRAIDVAHFRDVVSSPFLANIRVLEAGGAGLDDSCVEALAAAPALERVERLSLESNRVDELGVEAIFRSTTLVSLTHLNLSHNAIADAPIAGDDPETWHQLEVLDLSYNDLSDGALSRWLEYPSMERVEVLQLSSTNLDSQSAFALADAAHMHQLRELDLSFNAIDDAGAIALSRSAHLRRLERLSIGHNNLSQSGLRALLMSPHLPDAAKRPIRWLLPYDYTE